MRISAKAQEYRPILKNIAQSSNNTYIKLNKFV